MNNRFTTHRGNIQDKEDRSKGNAWINKQFINTYLFFKYWWKVWVNLLMQLNILMVIWTAILCDGWRALRVVGKSVLESRGLGIVVADKEVRTGTRKRREISREIINIHALNFILYVTVYSDSRLQSWRPIADSITRIWPFSVIPNISWFTLTFFSVTQRPSTCTDWTEN